jgi:hypothetical protein
LFATNLILMLLLVVANPLNLRPDQNALLCWLLLGGAIIVLLDFYALMWVGMWLGLQGGRQQRTVMKIVARVLLPPWVAVLVFVLMGAAKMGPRELSLPILVWFVASFMYDLVVGGQAAANISQQFRQAAALGSFGAPVTRHGKTTPVIQPMSA